MMFQYGLFLGCNFLTLLSEDSEGACADFRMALLLRLIGRSECHRSDQISNCLRWRLEYWMSALRMLGRGAALQFEWLV